MTSYVDFEAIEVGKYAADISIECDVITVDNGIGHYEFWGSTGYHVDICNELNGEFGITINSVWDEECNEINPSSPEIIKLVDEWINNNESEIKERLLNSIEE